MKISRNKPFVNFAFHAILHGNNVLHGVMKLHAVCCSLFRTWVILSPLSMLYMLPTHQLLHGHLGCQIDSSGFAVLKSPPSLLHDDSKAHGSDAGNSDMPRRSHRCFFLWKGQSCWLDKREKWMFCWLVGWGGALELYIHSFQMGSRVCTWIYGIVFFSSALPATDSWHSPTSIFSYDILLAKYLGFIFFTLLHIFPQLPLPLCLSDDRIRENSLLRTHSTTKNQATLSEGKISLHPQSSFLLPPLPPHCRIA